MFGTIRIQFCGLEAPNLALRCRCLARQRSAGMCAVAPRERSWGIRALDPRGAARDAVKSFDSGFGNHDHLAGLHAVLGVRRGDVGLDRPTLLLSCPTDAGHPVTSAPCRQYHCAQRTGSSAFCLRAQRFDGLKPVIARLSERRRVADDDEVATWETRPCPQA